MPGQHIIAALWQMASQAGQGEPAGLKLAAPSLCCCRFGPHRGDYMFHCHNLMHEDHDMMRAYHIVGGADQDGVPAANPAFTLPINIISGVIYNNFA